MAIDFNQILNTIATAVLGKDMRTAIHDGLEYVNGICVDAKTTAEGIAATASSALDAATEAASTAAAAKSQAQDALRRTAHAMGLIYLSSTGKIADLDTGANYLPQQYLEDFDILANKCITVPTSGSTDSVVYHVTNVIRDNGDAIRVSLTSDYVPSLAGVCIIRTMEISHVASPDGHIVFRSYSVPVTGV